MEKVSENEDYMLYALTQRRYPRICSEMVLIREWMERSPRTSEKN